jgi:hypothetical protein
MKISAKLASPTSACAIEGPDGLALEQMGEADEDLHHAALMVVRKVCHLPGIRNITNYMMGIARVP